MKLKGDWDSGTTYSVGDVVRYTNGVIYHLQKPCAAGITPIDTAHWGRVDQTLVQAALFALDAIDVAKDAADAAGAAATAAAEAAIAAKISDDAIALKGADENDYLITIDTSGETPDVIATLVEDETGDEEEAGT